MDKIYINKKLEFLTGHLESLADYSDISLDKLKDKPKDLKYVEKLIQELVDCAIDINENIVENMADEKPWSNKQSFRDLENKVLKKQSLEFGEENLKIFIDTVAFRNEIVHSYDINVYIIWSKRNLKTILNIYREYSEKIIKLLNTIKSKQK